METTGYIRGTDNLGRIVIPKGIRRILRIEVGDPLEIFIDNDNICLKKYEYDFTDKVEDLARRFSNATDAIGHKNTREIKDKFREIKELWLDT